MPMTPTRLRRSDVVLYEGRERCDAAAEHRAELLHDLLVEFFRNRGRPDPVAPHAVREPAVPADDGLLAVGAPVVAALEALVAMRAGVAEPAEADTLAFLQFRHVLPDGRDRADDLVPADERVLAHAPLVVEHRHVAVADAARLDLDLDLPRLQLAGVVLERLELALGFIGGIGVEGVTHETTLAIAVRSQCLSTRPSGSS